MMHHMGWNSISVTTQKMLHKEHGNECNGLIVVVIIEVV